MKMIAAVVVVVVLMVVVVLIVVMSGVGCGISHQQSHNMFLDSALCRAHIAPLS
jgi:hypothetical protein